MPCRDQRRDAQEGDRIPAITERVIIISRIDDRKALTFAGSLGEDLQRSGYSVQYDTSTARALGQKATPVSESDAGLAIVIGGDGSILLAVQRMRRQIPVLGINWGEVGFLADLEPAEAVEFLNRPPVPFETEQRMRITLMRDGEHLGDALNEALIVTTRPSKMLRFSVLIDGIPAERFRADGLLISTPTGSTAYAMSAGGPIVDPRIEGFLLVPLAPFMLSSRPHLISSSRSVKVRLESAKPAKLVIDGQKTIELGSEALIDVKKATDPAIFVDCGKNFFEKVNRKLRHL